VSLAILGILCAYLHLQAHFERKLAEEIHAQKYTQQINQDTFRQLAIADVPVDIARSSEANGRSIPSGFCLYITNAQAADFKDGTGRIFFTSPRSESELGRLAD
jgi:hypothetical protein